jgi:hypothetical protein
MTHPDDEMDHQIASYSIGDGAVVAHLQLTVVTTIYDNLVSILTLVVPICEAHHCVVLHAADAEARAAAEALQPQPKHDIQLRSERTLGI